LYLLLVLVIYVFFAKHFVDWKRWKEYYPTVQYFIICNLLYNFIFYQHTLWKYKAVTVSWLNHTLIEIAFSFFVVPIALIIYLQYFPKKKSKFVYVGVWISYFSALEFIFYKKGLFVYENGWNVSWSILFNLITFVMIRVHYLNPLMAILLTIPISIILLFFFHPSLVDLK
jgi:hypothetical protein